MIFVFISKNNYIYISSINIVYILNFLFCFRRRHDIAISYNLLAYKVSLLQYTTHTHTQLKSETRPRALAPHYHNIIFLFLYICCYFETIIHSWFIVACVCVCVFWKKISILLFFSHHLSLSLFLSCTHSIFSIFY